MVLRECLKKGSERKLCAKLVSSSVYLRSACLPLTLTVTLTGPFSNCPNSLHWIACKGLNANSSFPPEGQSGEDFEPGV